MSTPSTNGGISSRDGSSVVEESWEQQRRRRNAERKRKSRQNAETYDKEIRTKRNNRAKEPAATTSKRKQKSRQNHRIRDNERERQQRRRNSRTPEEKNADNEERRQRYAEEHIDTYGLCRLSNRIEIPHDLLKQILNQKKWDSKFQGNLSLALLLYHLNSGHYRFDEWKEFCSAYTKCGFDTQGILQEIQEEEVTMEETSELINQFYEAHNFTDGQLYACGCCGRRQSEDSIEQSFSKFNRMIVGDEMSQLLKLSIEEREHYDELRARQPTEVPLSPHEKSMELESVYIEPWRILSVASVIIDGDEELYHLHPELVEREIQENGIELRSTMICRTCWESLKKKRVPKLSIAGGVDFGYFRRGNGLPELTLHEKLILAKCRLYFASVKLSSNTTGKVNFNVENAIRGNAILFMDDTVEIVSQHFESQWLKDSIHIHIMDDKGKDDYLMHKMLRTTTLLARPWALYRWMVVLKSIHSSYHTLQIPVYDSLAEQVNTANESIIQNAMLITDPGSIRNDNTVGSDVARAQQNEETRGEENNEITEGNGDPLPLRTAYIVDTPGTGNNKEMNLGGVLVDSTLQFVEDHVSGDCGGPNDGMDTASIDDFQTTLNTPVEVILKSTRECNPVNEIEEDGDRVLSLAFPFVFMMGKAYGSKSPGTLSLREKQHLYNQFTMVPEKEELLVGYLFNTCQRFKVNRGVKSHVSGTSKAVTAVNQLLSDPKLKEDLQEAAENKSSSAAKRIVRQFAPHLRFSGIGVGYGAVECYDLKSKVFEMCKRFGMPSAFLTISPGDVDNPRAYRASFSTVDNKSFPAVLDNTSRFGQSPEEFMNFLRSGCTKRTDIDITNMISNAMAQRQQRSDRAKCAMRNPMSYVGESKKLIADVLAILIGRPPENFLSEWDGKTKRTTTYYKLKKGALGHNMAYIGVVEDHAKGTLHYHILCFGGLTPYALQKFSNEKEFQEAIQRALDSMYKSQITPEIAIAAVCNKVSHDKKYKTTASDSQENISVYKPNVTSPFNSSVSIPQIPLLDNQLFFRSLPKFCMLPSEIYWKKKILSDTIDYQASRQMWHHHMFTCHKGLLGSTGCRLCMPAGCIPITKPVELWLRQEEYDAFLDMKRSARPDGSHSNREDTGSIISGDTKNTTTSTVASSTISLRSLPSERPSQIIRDSVPALFQQAMEHLSFTSITLTEFTTNSVRYLKFDPPPTPKIHLYPYAEKIQCHGSCFFREVNDKVVVWETGRPIPQMVPMLESIMAQIDCEKEDCSTKSDSLGYEGESMGSLATLDTGEQKQRRLIQALYQYLCEECNFSRELPFWEWLDALTPDLQLQFFNELVDKLRVSNGEIATFNPTILFATGSHTNCQLLGARDQALGAICYICPYLGKRKAPIEESIALLNKCFEEAQRYPSNMPDDTNPNMRFARMVLSKTLNKMNLKMELSSYQIAAAELGMPVIICSETFVYRKTTGDIGYHDFVSGYPCREMAQSDIAHNPTIWQQTQNAEEPEQNSYDETYESHGADVTHSSTTECEIGVETEDKETSEEANGNHHTVEDAVMKKKTFYISSIDEYPVHVDAITAIFRHRYFVSGVVKANKRSPSNETQGVFIPRAELYLYRGVELRSLSRHEYGCIVQIAPYHGEDESKRKRSRMARFHFHREFPLHKQRIQCLRGKQCTAIVCDKWPPNPQYPPPLDSPEYTVWKNKADEFAKYVLVEFRPEIYNYGDTEVSNEHPVSYTWGDLLQWIQACQQGECMINYFRLSAVKRQVEGLRGTSYAVKQMLFSYRSRVRHLWTPKESTDQLQKSYKEFLERIQKKKDDLEQDNGPDPGLTAVESRNSQRTADFDGLVCECFRKSVAHTNTPGNKKGYGYAQTVLHAESICTNPPLSTINQDDFNEEGYNKMLTEKTVIAKKIRDFNFPMEEEKDRDRQNDFFARDDDNNVSVNHIDDEIRRQRSGLNPKQAQVFDHYVQYLRSDGETDVTQILLIHGMGGVGKTEAIKRLDKIAPLFGKTILKTAFNCINALAFDGGQTTSSLIDSTNANFFPNVFPQKRLQHLMTLVENAVLICIDEISNQAPYHVAQLSHILQYIRGNTEPFGGIPVIFIGDFGQKGPVKAGDTIPKALCQRILFDRAADIRKMQIHPNSILNPRPATDPRLSVDHPYTVGANIFRKAKYIEMTEQMRSVDPNHTEFITRMYHGESPQMVEFRQRYKFLRSEDYTNDPTWYEAPIITATNRERLSLIHEQTILFAKHTGNVIVRWKNLHRKWKQQPAPAFRHEAIFNDPVFFDYFTPGIPCLLNAHVNKPLGIVNGLKITQHSLVMRDSESTSDLVDKIANSNPGDIITLDFYDKGPLRPAMVVFEVTLPKDSKKEVIEAYEDLMEEYACEEQSSTTRSFLLPIAEQAFRRDWLEVTVRGKSTYRVSRVQVRTFFPFDIGLVMTVEKSQGQTLPRIIASVSLKPSHMHQVNFSSLYVIFTRVKQADHIRLLLYGDTDDEKWRSFQYIERLKPDPYTTALLSGFRSAVVCDNINLDAPPWSRLHFNESAVVAKLASLQ